MHTLYLDHAQMTIDYMSAVNSTLMQRYGFSSPTVIHAFEFNSYFLVCKFCSEVTTPLVKAKEYFVSWICISRD